MSAHCVEVGCQTDPASAYFPAQEALKNESAVNSSAFFSTRQTPTSKKINFTGGGFDLTMKQMKQEEELN